MKSLVMVSGGFDSTVMAYQLLTTTEKELHIHHLSYQMRQNRFPKEREALSKIIPWLQNNCRPFQYTESVYSHPAELGSQQPYDIGILAFVSAMIMSFSAKDNNFYDSVYIGSTKDDLSVPKLQQRKRMKEEIFSNTMTTLRTALAEENTFVPEIKIVEPYWSFTIEDMQHLAPRELIEMSWSCRTPINDLPCEKCFACRRRKRIGL